MIKEPFEPIRIGYIDGAPKRVNERVVDSQWIQYLGEYAELVKIPPFQIYKLFGGTINNWLQQLPKSLQILSDRLDELCRKYRVRTLYMNLPFVIPYLLMARNYAGLDVGLLFITHSVGSEYWMKQWTAIAPFLTMRDVLLTSTETSKKALMQISDKYQIAKLIPLCISMPEQAASTISERNGKRLLSIGRIEDVKNIDILLETFALLLKEIPDLHLTIAGEFTGISEDQIQEYRQTLELITQRHKMENNISFVGAVVGEQKNTIFRKSDLLINLSTDPGETFGYNLIEAMMWELPVICSNWDGFQEIIESGVDGYLIDCNWDNECPVIDQQQIVHRCLFLLEKAVRIQSLANRSRENARRYDFQIIVPQIMSAVREAMVKKVEAQNDTAAMAMSSAIELKKIFHLENLNQMPFINESLAMVPSLDNTTPVHKWMPLVKPVIHHFAGRQQHAKL
ncbi:glycosyltransferase [Cohnella endophytica]|uniref:Glycosyltransferase n=1 Tax=Cohnella endophytica TaxID=2419778 RepID=A0A494XXH4_9BACL|nr:glycosyltransferase family 4 protein [Cohnella endophytica]RKP54424.1 glycosyltransferase [Cohnella endophytica]